MTNKKLTFIESLMLVAGAGIGTGILTIPYAISKIGVFGTITVQLNTTYKFCFIIPTAVPRYLYWSQ